MNKFWKSAALYGVIFLAVLVVVVFSNRGLSTGETATQTPGVSQSTETYTYGDILREMDAGNVQSVTIARSNDASDYGEAEVVLRDGRTVTINLSSVSTFQERVDQEVLEGKVDTLDIAPV